MPKKSRMASLLIWHLPDYLWSDRTLRRVITHKQYLPSWLVRNGDQPTPAICVLLDDRTACKMTGSELWEQYTQDSNCHTSFFPSKHTRTSKASIQQRLLQFFPLSPSSLPWFFWFFWFSLSFDMSLWFFYFLPFHHCVVSLRLVDTDPAISGFIIGDLFF